MCVSLVYSFNTDIKSAMLLPQHAVQWWTDMDPKFRQQGVTVVLSTGFEKGVQIFGHMIL